MPSHVISIGLLVLATPAAVSEQDGLALVDNETRVVSQEAQQEADRRPRLNPQGDRPPRRRDDATAPQRRSPADARPHLRPPRLRDAPPQRDLAERQTTIVRLGNASAADVAKTLTEWQAAEQRSSDQPMPTIVPVVVSNSLLVTGTEKQLQTIIKIVEQLDQPAPQVRIQVALVKLTSEEAGEENIRFTTDIPKGSIKEILKVLRTLGDVRVIAQSELQMVDNNPAMLQLGGRVPRITGAAVSSRGRTNTVSVENVGTIIQATCRVSDQNRITMQIELESSEAGPKDEGVVVSESQDGGPIMAPIIETMTLQTTVTANDGESLVLGGIAYRSGERRGDVLLVLHPTIVK